LRGVELPDSAQPRDDGPGALERPATVEGPRLEEDALARSDVGADPHHVDHAVAVGSDGATLPSAGLVVVGRCGELARGPGIAAVGGTSEQDRFGSGRAAESDVADIGVAEVGAALGVVGPDLFLVAEEGLVLPGDDHRVHPGVVVTSDGARQIIGAGHRDGGIAGKAGIAREVGGDVRVVQPLPIGPREVA
jgi:hypothetical protein